MKHGLFAALMMGGAAVAQPVQPTPAETWPVGDALAIAPQTTLTNGRLTARIALPDPANGFYRGTRFDQAGVVTSLTLNGREFYGPWFERIAPDVLDYTYVPQGVVAGPDSAVSGPVEEFAPISFTPQAGTRFVKIGVGLLLQPDDQPYDHYRHYEIVDGGVRQTKTTPTSVTFVQTLAGVYDYEKTLRIAGNQLVIEHRLKNLGTAAIATTVYDHNFLRLVPGNAGIKVTFPFAVKAAAPPAADLIAIFGHSLTYLRAMKDKERLSFPITGFGVKPSDYAFLVEANGAGVSVTGDQPLTRVNIFSIDRVQAVEPYIAIDLPPGAQKHWTYTYTYTAP